MSDYVKYKLVRTVLGCKKDDGTWVSDVFPDKKDFDEYRDWADSNSNLGYEVSCSIDYKSYDMYYTLDYVISHDYGVDSGDYGRSRALTENERDRWYPRFKSVCSELDETNEIRLVEFCYYNCSEPVFYFDNKNDSFYDEV